jgi:hypothetical protein
MMGERARQGPHHSAQKSTIAGFSERRISCSKFWSVTSTTSAMACAFSFSASPAFRLAGGSREPARLPRMPLPARGCIR